jgi:hypothetical protein
MALLVPNVGEVEILTRALTFEGSKLKLYTNDYTATETSIIGNFTECAVAGYAHKTLTGTVSGGTWVISTASNITTASYAQQSYAITTATSCYGYMVTNSAGTVVLWAERFTGAPFTLPAGGGTINVTVNITGD